MNQVARGAVQDHQLDGQAEAALELTLQPEMKAIDRQGRLGREQDRDIDVTGLRCRATGNTPEEICRHHVAAASEHGPQS